MDESAVGTQFDFGETNNVATGIRTINLEHPIIYAHNNKIIEPHGGARRPSEVSTNVPTKVSNKDFLEGGRAA